MQATWIRSAALAAACLCGMAVPMALQQTPLSEPRTGMIAGRIVDASNDRPIAGVTIALSSPSVVTGRGGPARQFQTDTSGRFVFNELGSGIHQFFVQRPGYLISNLRPIELVAEQRVLDVVLRLRKLGALGGAIVDENGDPVVGMTVTAFRRVLANGQMVSLPSGEARSDDRGAYRISNVPAGEYTLCACRRDPIPVDGVLLATLASGPTQLIGVASRALREGADVASVNGLLTYAPAFHPSGMTMSRATRVTIADGEERANIDIAVPIVRAARLSGRVVGAPGSVSASSIRLRPAGEVPDAITALEPMIVQPDGRFDFANIAPGSYVVTAQVSSLPFMGGGPSGAALALIGGRISMPTQPAANQNNPTAGILWGKAAVTIGDADVSGVTISLQPTARVTVKVELPASLAPPPQGAPSPVRSFQLTPLSVEYGGITNPFGILQRDGSFVISGVAPGKYGVVSTAPLGLRLEKTTLRGVDVTDVPIEVGDTDVDDLVLTFVTAVPARVSGTTTNGADSTVLFFPADRRFWAQPGAARRRFGAALVNRDRAFRIETLPPGEYLMLMVTDAEAMDWQIQSRLEALAPRAKRITVNDGDNNVGEVKR